MRCPKCRDVLTQVPVDSLGVHMFPLAGGQVLCVEITADESGCKIVSIQSVVKICNHCDIPLEIAALARQVHPKPLTLNSAKNSFQA